MTEAASTTTAVRRGARPAVRPWRRDLGLIVPTVLLIFGAILDFGAAEAEPAVFWAVLQCAWAGALFFFAAGADRPIRAPVLQVAAAVLFVLLLAWLVVATLPLGGLGPFHPAPAWDLAGGDGALSIAPAATRIEALKLLGLGAIFCCGWLLAQDELRADRMATTVLVVGAAYAVWAFAAHFADPTLVLDVHKSYHFDRMTGSFFSANTAGSLFGVLSALAWVSALRGIRQHIDAEQGLRMSRRLTGSLVRMGGATLFWAAMLLTASRAAFAATALCLIVVTTIEIVEGLTRRRAATGKILAYTVPAVLGMLVLFTATVGPRILNRVPELGADGELRGQIFAAYFKAAGHAPLAGHGLGSFHTLNSALTTPENFIALWNLGAVHNIYLQWWLEGGAVGFGLMAAVLACLFVDAAQRRMAGRAGRTRAATALTVSALLLMHNSVDYSIQVPAVAAIWALLLGLGAAPSTSRAGAPGRSGSGSGRRRRRLDHDELKGELA